MRQVDQSLVVPPAMPNLLQDNIHKREDDIIVNNEVLTASCENLEPSSHNAPIAPAEHESKGNDHGPTLTAGESSLHVLNFSTNQAIQEQLLVEPSLSLPLSQRGFAGCSL